MGSSEINVLLESLKRIHTNLDTQDNKIDTIKEILIQNSDHIVQMDKRISKLEKESMKKPDWKFISIMMGIIGVIITAFSTLHTMKFM